MGRRGLLQPRLDRLHDVLSGYVDRKQIPGMVALVSRGDDVHVEVLGSLSLDNAASMKRDAIFRIASISKPKGRADSEQILSRATMELMTSDRLTPSQRD